LTREITDEKIRKYMATTQKALEKVKVIAPSRSFLAEIAEDFFDMAKRYHEDAIFFKNNGNIVDAFAAVNYAHGWLDAGVRLGLFDVGMDDELFTLAR